MLPCSITCIKYTHCVFNGLVILTGLALIVGGVWVVRSVHLFKVFLVSRFFAPPIVLIIVGLAIFVIAFIGCWGAYKDWPLFLYIYALFLILILIIEITIGIIAGMTMDGSFEDLLDIMRTSMENFDYENEEQKRPWDDMQHSLQCCGVESAYDWKIDDGVPASCCNKYDPDIHRHHVCVNIDFAYKVGCFHALRQLIIENSKILLGIAIGFAVFQLGAIFFACILAREIIFERKNRIW